MQDCADSKIVWAAFDTAIGRCAVAWGDAGIVGAQLPELDAAALHARMQRRFPGAAQGPPGAGAAGVIAAIQALLRGEAMHLSGTMLDWRGIPEFHRRVYEITLTIPPGRTLTYGEVASRLGEPGAARAVGQALGKNPFALESCPATGCSPLAAEWVVFRRPAARPPSSGCSPSRARASVTGRRCFEG